MSNVLPLTSDRWGSLEVFFGDPSDIPGILMSIEREPRPGFSRIFMDLKNRIWHQFSPCEATYAVLPHLVEIGKQRPPALCPELWTTIGLMASTIDNLEQLPPKDLYQAFREAVGDAESLSINSLINAHLDAVATYYLGVGCAGLARNRLGKLVMDHFEPEPRTESTARCLNCGEYFAVALFGSGFQAVIDDADYPSTPDDKPPRIPALSHQINRHPNPWQPIADAITDILATGVDTRLGPHFEAGRAVAKAGLSSFTSAELSFCLLGSVLAVKGHGVESRRYFHACDQITCPFCREVFVFADGWWGNFSESIGLAE